MNFLINMVDNMKLLKFDTYLIQVGIRSLEYSYDDLTLFQNIDYLSVSTQKKTVARKIQIKT